MRKDGVPFRHIVSLKGTPTYGLAKWLFRRLKFLTDGSDTTVSLPAQLLEKVKGDLAIETIELIQQSKYDKTENCFRHAQVLQLLKFCLRTYFKSDGTIYEQVKGPPMRLPISRFIAEAVLQWQMDAVAMGMPLGLLLANMLMDKPEAFQLRHRAKGLGYHERYVDDIVVIAQKKNVSVSQQKQRDESQEVALKKERRSLGQELY
nr:unnamed protein product [Spirometra erinaceieuropaei]